MPDPETAQPQSPFANRRSPLHLAVVSPAGTLYEGEVDSVVMPAWDGLMGVLPGHAPLLAMLRPGTVRVRALPSSLVPDPQLLSFRVTGGFADVGPTLVRLIADSATQV